MLSGHALVSSQCNPILIGRLRWYAGGCTYVGDVSPTISAYSIVHRGKKGRGAVEGGGVSERILRPACTFRMMDMISSIACPDPDWHINLVGWPVQAARLVCAQLQRYKPAHAGKSPPDAGARSLINRASTFDQM
jgi:hypothetical protein